MNHTAISYLDHRAADDLRVRMMGRMPKLIAVYKIELAGQHQQSRLHVAALSVRPVLDQMGARFPEKVCHDETRAHDHCSY